MLAAIVTESMLTKHSDVGYMFLNGRAARTPSLSTAQHIVMDQNKINRIWTLCNTTSCQHFTPFFLFQRQLENRCVLTAFIFSLQSYVINLN